MMQLKNVLRWCTCAPMLCVAAFLAPQTANAEIEAVDGVYQLSTGQDLADFATLVNGSSDKKIDAVLTADIDMSGIEFTPIGERDKGYAGTFDGQRHVISNLVVNIDRDFVGVFGSIAAGAVIKNFTVDETCSFTGKGYLGVVGGYSGASGSFLMDGIGSDANFTGSGPNVSGMFGVNMGSSATGFVISNCYVAGKIKGSRESAAISGWATNGTVKNCYSIAEVTGADSEDKEFSRNAANGAKYINCYDIKGQVTPIASIKNAAYGKLAFLLNGDQGKIYFVQDLGSDEFPKLAGDKRVYAASLAGLNCAGQPLGEPMDVIYTNNPQEIPPHSYEEGVCSVCGHVDENAFEMVNGAYEIANAGQLYWFAQVFNNSWMTQEQRKAFSGRLVADIDYTAYNYMIGEGAPAFEGKFDGQGHSIDVNFVKDDASSNCALFVSGLRGAEVCNLRVNGNVETNGNFAAGLASHAWDNTKVSHVVTDVDIMCHKSGDGTNAGLIAVVEMETWIDNVLILGSQNTDNGTSNCGGIVGWSSNLSHITNAIVATGMNVGTNDTHTVSRNGGNVRGTNIFYTIPFGGTSNATEADPAKIANGEMAMLLGWGQKLGVDEMPSPLSKDYVYQYGTTITNEEMPALEMPVTSTPENPRFYYIMNSRSGKFAEYTGGTMNQVTEKVAPANMFYFVAAGEPEGDYLPVTIHNALSGGKSMANFSTWNGSEALWYIHVNPSMTKNGLYIGTVKETSTNAWWNDYSGSTIGSWSCDGGSIWQFQAVAIEDVPDMALVTYNHKIGDEVMKVEKAPVVAGSAYPEPSFPYFVTGETPEGVVDAPVVVDLNVEVVTPFEASTDYSNAHWYQIINKKSASPRYLQYPGEEETEYVMTDEASSEDNYFWSFWGNPYTGYIVKNRAAGEGASLNIEAPANGAAPTVYATDAPTVWAIDGRDAETFGLGADGFWINQYGGGNANIMKLWQSGSASDLGSTLNVAPVQASDLIEDNTEPSIGQYDNVIAITRTNALTLSAGTWNLSAVAGAKATLVDYFNGKTYEIALTNAGGKVNVPLPANYDKLLYLTIPAGALMVDGGVATETELSFTYYVMNGVLVLDESELDFIKSLGNATGIGGVEAAKNVNVFTPAGVQVKSNVPAAEAFKGLPGGTYIVNGKKVTFGK